MAVSISSQLLNSTDIFLALFLVPTSILVLVCPYKPVLPKACRLQRFLLVLVTDLPGLLLAVLGVALFLSLLGMSLHLHFADLL